MRAEISTDGTAQPTQSAEMAAEEMKARMGLAEEFTDVLTDIMAVLLHGSDTSKDSAIEKLVEAAMASGEAGKEQARMFRSAVVAGGGVPALIACLSEDMPRRQYLAASAMHALALDDPTTDADNFHQLEICQAGAVQPLVKLLDSEDLQLQQAATGALSALAENPTCQTMIAAEGAIAPLRAMASYGSDMQKLSAMGALDVLTVNNAGVQKQLQQEGAANLLEGIASMGSPLLRDEAAAFSSRLKDSAPASLSSAAHVKAARDTRVRYDGVRQRAFRMMQGWQGGSEGQSEGTHA